MKSPEHPIFQESINFIRSRIGFTGLNQVQQSIVERMIHSSGDFSVLSAVKFSPSACEKAIAALQNGAKILTDTYMAKAAVSSVAQRTLDSDVQCILGMAPASLNDTSKTRSEVGMRRMWLDIEKEDGLLSTPIVVIGSAPTALMSLLDLIDQGSKVPSLIIGMPVGFIGVTESKNRLLNSKCSYIVLEGSRGGASLAAASINALMRYAVK